VLGKNRRAVPFASVRYANVRRSPLAGVLVGGAAVFNPSRPRSHYVNR